MADARPATLASLPRTAPAGSLFVFADEAEAHAFEERAAIREHDGRIPRAAAERLAWADVLAARRAGPQFLDALQRESAEPLKRAG